MSSAEHYIGGEHGGIPEEVFQPGYNKNIKGMSGTTKLSCQTINQAISIRDRAHPTFGFGAFLLPDDLLSLNIKNRDGKATKTNDIQISTLKNLLNVALHILLTKDIRYKE